MRWVVVITFVASAALTVGLTSRAASETVMADLRGFDEVPPVSTSGTGEFQGVIGETSFEFTLSYSELQGTVQEAHIHFGRAGVKGGISVFLCSNKAHAPADAQKCPEAPATVTGVIGPSDVIGPIKQGIEPAAFKELMEAIKQNVTYVDVHTDMFPTGEIRGQLFRDVASQLVEEILELGVQPLRKPGPKSKF